MPPETRIEEVVYARKRASVKRKPRILGKVSKKAKKRAKTKKISSAKADSLFSKWIRARDGKCVRCERTENLQNSHFWPRGISATRYDPTNCDTLCYACHYGNASGWERAKQGGYRDFKVNQLGEKGYNELRERSISFMKRDQAIILCMNFLKAEDTSQEQV